jgi:purine-nucleoside phosphorylase
MSFPNLKNKYKEESLITPQKFLEYERKLNKHPKFEPPTGVIFCYSKRLLNFIVKNYKVKKVEGFNGELYLLKETNNKIGIIGKFGIGAPVAAALMEELIAFGIKKFVSIGEAGSLQKDLKVGGIVVCEKAVRDEGVSYHYLKPSKYIHAPKSMIKKIKKVLNNSKIRYRIGTTWTTDAPYRETLPEIKKYQKEGVLTVEMEASAIFAIAQYKKVEAGVILTISDYLLESEWKPKFHLTTKFLKKLFQIAKKVLLIGK